MKALLHDPDRLDPVLGEAPEPEPAAHELVLDVDAVGVNFLDIAYRDRGFDAGQVPGVDAAGRVAVAAQDGSGPPVGTRVVSFGGGGAWAQRRAVATVDCAVVPNGVDLGAAVALPGAGVTALQVVRAMGDVQGRRVLVTGASGGVGRFVVQLAARGGAEVVAAVGSPERRSGLAELGATTTAVGLDGLGGIDQVVDTVGGTLLADAFHRLGRGGRLWSVGQASGQATTIDLEQERVDPGGHRSLSVFVVEGPFGPDLAILLDMLADGSLSPCIGWRGPWTEVAAAASALRERTVTGKVVLDVGTDPAA